MKTFLSCITLLGFILMSSATLSEQDRMNKQNDVSVEKHVISRGDLATAQKSVRRQPVTSRIVGEQ